MAKVISVAKFGPSFIWIHVSEFEMWVTHKMRIWNQAHQISNISQRLLDARDWLLFETYVPVVLMKTTKCIILLFVRLVDSTAQNEIILLMRVSSAFLGVSLARAVDTCSKWTWIRISEHDAICAEGLAMTRNIWNIFKYYKYFTYLNFRWYISNIDYQNNVRNTARWFKYR